MRFSLTDVYALDPVTASKVLDQMRKLRADKWPAYRRTVQAAQQALKKFQDEAHPKLMEQKNLWDAYDAAQQRLETIKATANAAKQQVENSSDVEAKILQVGVMLDLLARAKETAAETNELAPKLRMSKEQIDASLAQEAKLKQLLSLSTNKEREAANLATYAYGLDWKNIRPTSHTRTDVDGKFTIHLTKSPTILFSFCNRHLGDNFESYCWLVNPSVKDDLIMLTNKNTIDTSSPDNFARAQ